MCGGRNKGDDPVRDGVACITDGVAFGTRGFVCRLSCTPAAAAEAAGAAAGAMAAAAPFRANTVFFSNGCGLIYGAI